MLILSYFLLLFAPPWLPGGGGGVVGGVGLGIFSDKGETEYAFDDVKALRI